MPGNFEIISQRALTRYVEPLVNRNANPIPANLVMLNRTPEVPRTSEEILLGYTGHVFAADVIADDQRAVVKTADMIETRTRSVPNIKIGKLITQTMADLLLRINERAALPGEPDVFRNYVLQKYRENIQSLRIRQEVMLNQMSIGTMNYNRLGIKMSGVDFGQPAICKLTVDPLWTDTTNATPIDDIFAAEYEVQRLYGKTYNRVEMSAYVFGLIVATDQFAAQAQLFAGRDFPAGSSPFNNPTVNQALLGRLLNKTIELRDETYEDQQLDGSIITRRYMPENIVRMTNTSDDNNQAAREFSLAVATESVIMNFPGVNVIGGVQPGALTQGRGPVAYATVPPDLNPPNATLWAAMKGFPAKNNKLESCAMTVA